VLPEEVEDLVRCAAAAAAPQGAHR
jgi:hypothetical protein